MATGETVDTTTAEECEAALEAHEALDTGELELIYFEFDSVI